ncbi:hypothetical protein [Bacteriovorax sp. Seq25_V]|uniref:hypothetical protein n=1 Tax=Bacteriovorax sp. Seq25_V TaxID=1201288 RepID=UPI000389F4E9|nr:hypothetical protein [Bacteriovorax sp. Seq25_V]EQC43502.1 hypothetical protein M900_0267 [Bacteriovorax sp. Seq25_V]
MSDKITFTERDFLYFRQWLCLDIKSVTWQGKYSSDFEKFWSIFFKDSSSLTEMSKRFTYAIERSKVGPISSWFTWLRDKFICYVFIEKRISLSLLSEELDIPFQVIARILRNFLAEVFPHHDEYLNEVFLVTNKVSKNIDINIERIVKEIGEELNFSGSHDEEVMTSMEVTLYEDWAIFLKKMEKDFGVKSLNLSQVNTSEQIRSYLQTFSNVLAIVGVTIFLVWLVEFANRNYEKYLSDKISIYEPQFRWEDKGLKFTEDQLGANELANFELDVGDIENVDDSESLLGEALEDQERVGVETDVVLTSLESLPKDFDVADTEQSLYEEERTSGYRDSRYGNTKVYRVMMRSSDTERANTVLKDLLKRYDVSQVDNVAPGLSVPGGYYYNLYVPRTYLKEFMAQVGEVDTAIIYESRTRTRRNPPGKNKVFIWVKSI